MLSTPLAKGLFQRAIMHSSPTVMAQPGKPNYVTLEDKTAAAGPVFEKYFPGKTLDDLRKLPAEEFYKDPAKIDAMYAVTSNMYAVIDGHVLTADSVDLLKEGALNGVDVIVGTVADERTALDGAPDKVMEIPAFHAYWKKLLGEELYARYSFEKLYPAVDRTRRLPPAPQGPGRPAAGAEPDRGFAPDRQKPSQQGLRVSTSIIPTPGRDREYYGAWHSSDLWYTFNSLRNEPGQRQWAPYDFELAEQASSLWANFVKTGDPNGEGLPAWPRSQPIQQRHLHVIRRDIDRRDERLAVSRHDRRAPQRAVPRLPDDVLRRERVTPPVTPGIDIGGGFQLYRV